MSEEPRAGGVEEPQAEGTAPAEGSASSDASRPVAADSQKADQPSVPEPLRVGLLVKKAWLLVVDPHHGPQRAAKELSLRERLWMGLGCMFLLALLFPMHQATGEASGVGYLMDVPIAACGMLVLALGLHLVRRHAFERDDARFADDLFLAGSFSLPIAGAAFTAFVFAWIRLSFLEPAVLAGGKVHALLMLYMAFREVGGVKERSAVVILALVLGATNLVFALRFNMGLLL